MSLEGWETDESSGFLTNFIGTISDAWFGTDENINQGRTLLLHWECTIHEVLQEHSGDLPTNDDDDPAVVISYACGSDWETNDGEVAEHPKGKRGFHASSALGGVLDALSGKVANYGAQAHRTDGQDLVVDMGHERCSKEDGHQGCVLEVLAKDGRSSTDARAYVGLTFEFAEVQIDYGMNKQTGQQMLSTRARPVRWLPNGPQVAEATEVKSKAKVDPKADAKARIEERAKVRAEKAKAKAQAEPARTENSTDPFTDVDDELAGALRAALEGADDFDTFVDLVVEIPAMSEDDNVDLLNHCLDVDNGPWAAKA